MGVRWWRGEVRGHSHFPDCLVLNEGGYGITEMTPPSSNESAFTQVSHSLW